MRLDELDRTLREGLGLLRQGRLREAQELSRVLLSEHPDHHSAWNLASEVAIASEDWPAAARHVDRLLSAAQASPGLLVRKAKILVALRRRAEAFETAGIADKLPVIDAPQRRAIARIFIQCNDPVAALASLERANRQFPGNPGVLHDLALAQFYLNRTEEAEANLTELLRVLPGHGGAIYLRSVLRPQTAHDNHIAEIERIVDTGWAAEESMVACLFALAKEYEDLNEYEKSFEFLQKGAALKRRRLSYRSAEELSSIREMAAAFTRAAYERPAEACNDSGAIFIVGMPRTGTTLIERILACHSQATSIGEFPDFPIEMTEQAGKRLLELKREESTMIQASLDMDFAEIGRRYMTSARQLAKGSKYFVDKLPHNFLYCGYIGKALPNARIIHIVRDPMDSCYSMYKTLFNQVYSFSYDLDELADYYVAYRNLMGHWHRVMPGRILDVTYEDIVNSPETEARRVLEWCGLDWEASVLEFHESKSASTTASAAQVRMPIYASSLGKWRHVERHFVAVRKRMQQAGLVDPLMTAG